ncbi:MAG TPA: hypothetical protein VGO89_01915, partial [Streptomyces sp.]|nr:hypothetical protein [Streptomyces sp.]
MSTRSQHARSLRVVVTGATAAAALMLACAASATAQTTAQTEAHAQAAAEPTTVTPAGDDYAAKLAGEATFTAGSVTV